MPPRQHLHEARNNGLHKMYRERSFLDSQGKLRYFNGTKFWPA